MQSSHIFTLLILFVWSQITEAQNQAPVISNISALADTVFHTLKVHYNLSDLENDTSEVIMAASADGGITYCLNVSGAAGDVGPGIPVGNNRYFEWQYPDSLSAMVGDFQIQLNANDWQTIDVQQIVDGIDSVNLRNNLVFLEGIRHRTAGVTHLQLVQDTLLNLFNFYGLDTATHLFPFGGYTGKNLTGRKSGSFNPCRTLIVDGHYDTVNNSPGADDNGAALAGMLEIVRMIQNLNLAYSVKFIGFDLEEAGLEGSEHYVASGIADDEDIAGVINMDMIAYYSNQPNTQTVPSGFDLVFPDLYQQLVDNQFRANFILSTANTFSDPLLQLFEATALEFVPQLLVGSISVPGNGELIPDSRRSDHAAFWDAGYMALHLSDGAETRNPNYHGPTDVLNTCNMTFATNVTKAVVATLLKLAIPMHGTVETAQVQVDPASGMSEIPFTEISIFVAPNPSKGIFQIHASQPVEKAFVFDATGRFILEQTKAEINLFDYEPGLYFLSVLSGEEVRFFKVVRF